HLLEAKNREFSQETELLTGVLDWLLGVNVNRSLARPIYATTPDCHVRCVAMIDRSEDPDQRPSIDGLNLGAIGAPQPHISLGRSVVIRPS
ncbi:MAG: hypothetical protein VB124_03160, partial [Burkholderia sp.]